MGQLLGWAVFGSLPVGCLRFNFCIPRIRVDVDFVLGVVIGGCCSGLELSSDNLACEAQVQSHSFLNNQLDSRRSFIGSIRLKSSMCD